MALLVEKHEKDNRVILDLDGELDVESSQVLRDELNQLIEEGRRRIAIDMSKVTYMDSSGLSALVTAHRNLGSRGELCLVGCRPTVERVLKFTQFDRVLDLYRNFEDLEAGNKDNLRAVSGVSKSVMAKQKAVSKVTNPRRPPDRPGRRLS